MPGGIDFELEKQQQQMLQMRTAQKLEQRQHMDFVGEKKRKSRKDALMAAGIFLGLLFILALLIEGGVL